MVAYGTEKPQSYRPRLVDERLQRLLSTFGAVEIRGTKWCGKSWAALAFGESVVHLDDPNVKALAEADPMLALQGAHPHVVDEWQEVPSTWDATRRAVDAARRRTRPVHSHGLFNPGQGRPLPIAVLGASRVWT